MSAWKERLARRVPIRDAARVACGSAADYRLEARAGARLVSVALVLCARHLSARAAKDAIDRLLQGDTVTVRLPMVEDHRRLAAELDGLGVRAARLGPPEPVDVKVIRERLRRSQDEFARRFQLEPVTVRGWEQHRHEPDQAKAILLKIIETAPEVVDRVLTRDPAPEPG
jgi:putative transcriptional regulator